MCSAMVGATPVYRCTWEASAIFSYGSRGTPGWANTLNRVPELPNAQEGSSMACSSRSGAIGVRSVMVLPACLVVETIHSFVTVEGLRGGRQVVRYRDEHSAGVREGGPMAVSIRDVAERAGVSVGTVSNVLNRPDRVSENVVERVH